MKDSRYTIVQNMTFLTVKTMSCVLFHLNVINCKGKCFLGFKRVEYLNCVHIVI